jgi:AmiR/NasT family two-component response regulator
MGIVMTRFELTASDAIALLRSYAYGHDMVLDDVAAAVVDGTVDLGQLQT